MQQTTEGQAIHALLADPEAEHVHRGNEEGLGEEPKLRSA